MKYTEPLDRLLRLGEEPLPLADYLALGITQDHRAELIRLATDPALFNAAENDPAFWGAVHAWYVLGQLKVTEAIAALLDLRDQYPYELLFDRQLPKAIAKMGCDAIPALKDYLWDTDRDEMTRAGALPCLEAIALTHRQPCVDLLAELLQQVNGNYRELAGLAICSLIDLEASEHIDTIRAAFAHDCVEISIPGDLEDVEIALGLRKERATPRPNYAYLGPETLEQVGQLRTMLENGVLDEAADGALQYHVIRSSPKVGRNDPCPCGSGKKYKKCCLR